MEHPRVLTSKPAGEGEGDSGHIETLSGIYADILRASPPAGDGQPYPTTDLLIKLDAYKVGYNGVAVPAQRSPNIPSFLEVDTSPKDSLLCPADGSGDVSQFTSNESTSNDLGRSMRGLPAQPSERADINHVKAVHGSLDTATHLKPLKAVNADYRRKARNIYHAKKSRRIRKVRRAVLEQETAWLQRDISRLKADIRAISEEKGVCVDVLLNHACEDRGVIPPKQ